MIHLCIKSEPKPREHHNIMFDDPWRFLPERGTALSTAKGDQPREITARRLIPRVCQILIIRLIL